MKTNQTGWQPESGVERRKEWEWPCYDDLPSEWRRWLMHAEMDLCVQDVWRQWKAGWTLEEVKSDWELIMLEHKMMNGWDVGYNGLV